MVTETENEVRPTVQPAEIVLYLTRPSVWELRCGGLDRMSFSLTRPAYKEKRHHLYPEVSVGRWSSPSGMISCRVLRKLDHEDLSEGLWTTMRRTAFPLMDEAGWDELLNEEPEGSVLEEDWMGEYRILVSLERFEDAVHWPVTLTGPHTGSRNQFRGQEPLPPDLDPVLAWLLPPRLQVLTDRPIDASDPSKGFQRPFWSHDYDGTTAIRRPLQDVVGYMPSVIGDAMRRAVPTLTADDPYPPVEWSATIDLWIAPGRSEGEDRSLRKGPGSSA